MARCIIATLLAEGALRPGLRYGSAFSGVDTFAAALEIELPGAWTYVYASEKVEYVRRFLLAAWGCRGLTEAHCYRDATGSDALSAPAVTLEVYTGECGPHSDSNRERDEADQVVSVAYLCRSFEHARRHLPEVIVVENVDRPSVVGPITCVLSKLPGYSMRHSSLCALEVGGSSATRDRHYWVLVKART